MTSLKSPLPLPGYGTDIQHVLLIGGSCSLRDFRQILDSFLPGVPVQLLDQNEVLKGAGENKSLSDYGKVWYR